MADAARWSDETHLYPVYARYPLRVAGGRGTRLVDESGREFADFFGGIAVNSLGYAHPRLQRVLREAADFPLHVSNLVTHPYQAPLAKRLCEITGLTKVFFTNSGTEAVEGAIKIARARSWHAGRGEKTGLIALRNSFHGRSAGSLSLTGQEKYRVPFEPLLPGVRHVDPQIAALEEAVGPGTCAVFMEPVQGEGGVRPLAADLLRAARALCDRHDALLVFDEIQCGMGRTGAWFRFLSEGVTPDLLCVAKPLAAGLPLGAVVGGPRTETALGIGEHGSTFGGGPLACRMALEVLSILEEEGLIRNAAQMGGRLQEGLRRLAASGGRIHAVRGAGLMVGVDLDTETKPVVHALLERGFVVATAGPRTLRLLPPLTITGPEIDDFVSALGSVLASLPDAQA